MAVGSNAFARKPGARADLKPGAVYAVDGGDGFLYYGQVAENRQLGFFRFRSKQIATELAVAAPFMSRIIVSLPSIGRALRAGKWSALGRVALRPELSEAQVVVQWPAGATTVVMWKGSEILGTASVADPRIQDFEIMAAYDAVAHVPGRLSADFLQPSDAWRAGGSVRRHRMMKEDFAKRFPDQQWHKLPLDWIPVSDN